jgi:cytoskeletal protein CcmA (bactofilin family)
MSSDQDPSRGAPSGPAILGKSVTIKGQIIGREDLTIDGEVEGTIELQNCRLTIGPSANVRAGVKARDVIVLGTLQGKVVTTDKTEIRSKGAIVGDVQTARIAIEDGAYLKGAVDITGRTADAPAQPRAAANASTTA